MAATRVQSAEQWLSANEAMKSKRTSKLKRASAERAQQRLIRRLEAENVMLKNYNGQLNDAIARLESAEKREAGLKQSDDR